MGSRQLLDPIFYQQGSSRDPTGTSLVSMDYDTATSRFLMLQQPYSYDADYASIATTTYAIWEAARATGSIVTTTSKGLVHTDGTVVQGCLKSLMVAHETTLTPTPSPTTTQTLTPIPTQSGTPTGTLVSTLTPTPTATVTPTPIPIPGASTSTTCSGNEAFDSSLVDLGLSGPSCYSVTGTSGVWVLVWVCVWVCVSECLFFFERRLAT